MSFIKRHLIKKIIEIVDIKQDYLNYTGMFYFDNKIKYKEDDINRMNKYSIYTNSLYKVYGYHQVSGPQLVDIYLQLKNNEFFVYKKIEGKDHKIRIKNA